MQRTQLFAAIAVADFVTFTTASKPYNCFEPGFGQHIFPLFCKRQSEILHRIHRIRSSFAISFCSECFFVFFLHCCGTNGLHRRFVVALPWFSKQSMSSNKKKKEGGPKRVGLPLSRLDRPTAFHSQSDRNSCD